MGAITIPKKVCLVAAICFNQKILKDEAMARLVNKFGAIDKISSPVDFSYTSYYENEMGPALQKVYVSFEELIDPISLPDIKIFTNVIEDEFSINTKRRLNIDPGYIELAKMVLATTKNFSHRIYIGKGIYGDVQLYWKGGGYQTNPWTYPDYKNNDTKSFFEQIREQYFHKIKEI